MQYYAPVSATGGLVAGDARNQVYAFDATRTNLCLQSQTMAVAPWANGGGLTVPTTNGVDPRGTGAACTLSDAAGTLGELTQAITVANDGTNYVASCYFTLGTSNQSKFGIRLSGGVAVDNFVEFNPASGVVISSAGTYTVTALVIAGVTWYRIAILIANNTSGNVTATPYFQPASSNVGATGTVIAFGAQFETVVTAGAATPSAYVQTGSVAETTLPGAIPSFLQGKAIDVQTFTGNGNSVAPIWANRALLVGIGGGGAGGGTTTGGCAGGGCSGEQTMGTVVTVAPGVTTAVTIGAAGARNAGAAGGAGGSTIFTGLLTLTGGGGGGAGGIGVIGAGGTGNGVHGSPGASDGTGGGEGGNGGLGGAGGLQATAGNDAVNFGGGGGGAGSTSTTGGNGKAGRLSVIYFRV